MISVLILTFNEELNLPRCLASVRWSDDVVVFDSGSTDRTLEIARAAGARVFHHPFVDYSAQREAARTLVEYKYPWVFALDADECPDDTLAEEIRQVAAGPDTGCSAYAMRIKHHFLGRWLKHASLYPTWYTRLYRPDEIRYPPRAVHEHPEMTRRLGELRGHLMHYSFTKGLADWFRKHIRYAELEAQENLRHVNQEALDWRGMFLSADPRRRRRALKSLSYRLPGRPYLRFWYMYLARGGFLDGRAGLTYCQLLAMYERMVVLEMMEIDRRRRGLTL